MKQLCSFCSTNPASKVIRKSTGDVYVCAQCIKQRMQQKAGASTQPAPVKKDALPSPIEIRANLDEYVIGQEDAKKVLSVALYNHYKRVKYTDQNVGGVELKKSNILMVGPTGSGKTHIVSTLARMLDVPFITADATALLGAGLREIETFLVNLVNEAGGDVKRAEQGIIFLDEVDKLAARYNRSSESIQQALLKTIEGTVADIVVKGKRVQVNTGNVLFVVGGAFVGLERIIHERVGGGMIGVEVSVTDLIRQVVPDDFARFGLIPEFLGRLPVIVGLEGLSKQALVDILTKPKNNLVAQYQKMFAMDGVKLMFDEDSLTHIADKALELNTGARGLRTIIEDALRDIMYTVPGEKNLSRVVISKQVVMKTGSAIFEYVHAKEEIENAALQPKRQREKNGLYD
jgi:ATP-dependent Clp protease ATP-binding subunit ClpX